MSASRIVAVDFFEATSPLSRPIADATHAIPAINFVVARVTLADGTTGEGYLLAFHFNPAAIRGALADVRALAVGHDAGDTRGFDRKCDREFEYFGAVGLLRWARGIVNLAMWDARGRQAGKPVWQLVGDGPKAARVPVYGSGGWLSYRDDELLAEVTGYVRRGFRAVKLKVGAREGIERDLHRIVLVRAAVGPEVRIMIDANQGLDLPRALALAEQARAHGIDWFEEPLEHTDFDGYAQLKARAGIKLAMGEREFDLVALHALAGRRALDLWQPDILRLGGAGAPARPAGAAALLQGIRRAAGLHHPRRLRRRIVRLGGRDHRPAAAHRGRVCLPLGAAGLGVQFQTGSAAAARGLNGGFAACPGPATIRRRRLGGR